MSDQKYDPITGEPIDDVASEGSPMENQPINNSYSSPVNWQQNTTIPNNMGNIKPQAFNPNTLPVPNNKKGLGAGAIAIIIAAVVLMISIIGVVTFLLVTHVGKGANNISSNIEDSVDEPGEDTSDIASSEDTEEPDDGTVVQNNSAEDLFTVQIDDMTYSFPMKISDLLADGWEFDSKSDSEKKLGTDSIDFIYLTYPGTSQEFSFEVTNFSMNALPINDCYAYSIAIYSYDAQKVGAKVSICDGKLVLGESTMDDVKKVLGRPTDTYDSASTTSLYYYDENDMSNYNSLIRIAFSEDSDGIYCINIDNRVAPEDMEEAEVSDEAPSYLSEYKAPSSLGNDYTTGNIQLEGEVYSVPVPLQVLVDDGWTYTEDENYVVGAGQEYSFGISKGDSRVNIVASNTSDNAVYLKNTIVTTISFYPGTYNTVDLSLPGGLTADCTEEDVKAYLEKNGITNYEYTKSYGKYEIYFDNSDDYRRGEIEIGFNDDGTLASIAITNYGWLNE